MLKYPFPTVSALPFPMPFVVRPFDVRLFVKFLAFEGGVLSKINADLELFFDLDTQLVRKTITRVDLFLFCIWPIHIPSQGPPQ